MAEHISIPEVVGSRPAEYASGKPPPVRDPMRFNFRHDALQNQKLDREALQRIAESLNEILKAFNVQAKFFVHEKTNSIVFQLYDMRKNQLIREVPSVKILDMVAKFIELMGVLIDEKA